MISTVRVKSAGLCLSTVFIPKFVALINFLSDVRRVVLEMCVRNLAVLHFAVRLSSDMEYAERF
jgi:hypothetical protein